MINQRKKQKKVINYGIVNIKTTFNNTIITISDVFGNTLCWNSAGSSGFKGSKKSTPFAAQLIAKNIAEKIKELGMQKVEIIIKGRGNGRDTSVRAIKNSGLKVVCVEDRTTVSHNGCRPPKKRRL